MDMKVNGDVLQNLLDTVCKAAYGTTKSEALAVNVCVSCKLSPQGRIFTDAGLREYKQSGLCEVCWDAIWAGTEEEDESL